MTNYLVFNHHSLPFDHRGDAEAAVPDFLKMCIEAQNAGIRIFLGEIFVGYIGPHLKSR